MQLEVSREEDEVSVAAGADGVSGWRREEQTGHKGLRPILFEDVCRRRPVQRRWPLSHLQP